MRHFIRVSTICLGKIDYYKKKCNIFVFEIYYATPNNIQWIILVTMYGSFVERSIGLKRVEEAWHVCLMEVVNECRVKNEIH